MHNGRQRWRTILGCVWIAVLCCGLVLATAPRPTTATQRVPAAGDPEQRQVVRIKAASREETRALSGRGLDLLEMRDGDDLFALVTETEINDLRKAGFSVSPDAEQTRLLPGSPQPNPVQGGYRTVEEGYALLAGWEASYPTLAKTFSYGSSWELLNPGAGAGYPLRGITLTNQLVPGPKPTFFLMSAIHAREMTTAELSLRFIDYLLTRYESDADIHWLLDAHTIVVMPFVNPDGRKLAETTISQRKNRNTADTPECSGTGIGIDLNRNSHFKWGTIDSPDDYECGATWPGKSVASEPEVSSLEAWVSRIFADLRGPNDNDPAPDNTPGVFISLHSYSNLVLWPYGWTYDPAPNAADLAGLGKKFASYNGYTAQQSTALYPTSGTTDDWAYGELGVAAYTFEVGPSGGSCGGFMPPFWCLDTGANFWGRNLPALLYAAKVARTPYLLSRGPDALTVAAVQNGASFSVTATISDTKNGNLAIAAAELYLDTPPWQAGATPVALAASDGAFSATSEAVQASIASPAVGRHILFVRGQDAAGNWGPVSAIWLDAPLIEEKHTIFIALLAN
jgi:hypothetical protein